ncbi:MAG: MarR family transcriptional regulator [SAR86 cluster bacterium]|uniref:MarR family transcriptional regulator n=1 Tax=SAR86 cluster bacterium TaxID=2030880 RepID=A0A2A4X0E1_9GAMM|nr:MAG: MarR family transcriptional regulator [SAR86 cluster bacterium]
MGIDVTRKKSSEPSESTLFAYFNEIGIIAQLSIVLFERNLPEGLNNSQFGVLNWFCRVDSEASPGRLATAFQVTAGAMTNTLKRLESKGLVKIEPDQFSGRKKKITITAKGEKVQKQAIAASAPLFQEFAENCPQENIELQIEQLQKVREYLDQRRYN